MRRGRTLFWTITGSVVAVVAVVTAMILVLSNADSATPSGAASSAARPGSSHASSQSPPAVIPKASGTYLSDLKPSGDLGGMVNPGPVKISGSIYPKSITFYCNVGDPTPFPTYPLKHNARRFQGTLGLAANSPQQFRGILRLLGDGRTLQTVTVSVLKPKTVDVKVTGVHTLQLECFGSGNSYTGGEAVAVVWGNARISGGH
jgi:hypothetical protein